jgi:hypothetical protein
MHMLEGSRQEDPRREPNFHRLNLPNWSPRNWYMSDQESCLFTLLHDSYVRREGMHPLRDEGDVELQEIVAYAARLLSENRVGEREEGFDDLPLRRFLHGPDDGPSIGPDLSSNHVGVEGIEARCLDVKVDLLPELVGHLCPLP